MSTQPALPPTPPSVRFQKYAQEPHVPRTSSKTTSSIDIEQEVARKQQLENENTAQDILLKRITLDRLFWFLAAETAFIFLFSLFQAIGRPDGFKLEEWSFRVLIGATIAQITGMLFVAVRYLFPKK
jgi:hypothetical protein